VFAVFALWPILTILGAALGPPDSAASSVRLAPGRVRRWRPGQLRGRVAGGAGFGTSMLTSVAVSGFVVLTAGVLSLLTGYAFGTMRVSGAGVLFPLFLLGLMVPTEVIVVPLYFDLRTLGLTNTFWAIRAASGRAVAGVRTFWMRAYFRSRPVSLIEAARLDGPGPHEGEYHHGDDRGRPGGTSTCHDGPGAAPSSGRPR